jgi:hypothetical protein
VAHLGILALAATVAHLAILALVFRDTVGLAVFLDLVDLVAYRDIVALVGSLGSLVTLDYLALRALRRVLTPTFSTTAADRLLVTVDLPTTAPPLQWLMTQVLMVLK